MYFVTKSEEELFLDIERFSGLSIAIEQALTSLADLRKQLIALGDGMSGDLSSLCRDFERFVASLKGMREQIGKCDPYHFPALTFLEFSQALHFVLRRVRCLLPPMYGEDPITGVSDKLEEIKNWCREEKRPVNITEEQFREGVAHGFEGMITFACKIAVAIRSYDSERKIERSPTQTDSVLARIEMTVEDTNEAAHRLDSRDRRHRTEAGTGGQVGFSVQKRMLEEWKKCQSHAEWFGGEAKGSRITKRMAYDFLVRNRRLPPIIDSFKTFCRVIDSARKLRPKR